MNHFWKVKSNRLGPLLFVIYINDLNQALKFCKAYHLADDTNLLHFSKSVYMDLTNGFKKSYLLVKWQKK